MFQMCNLKKPTLLQQSLVVQFDVTLRWEGLGPEKLQQNCKQLWISVNEQAAAVICGVVNAASSAKRYLSMLVQSNIT